jgi:hypothetical protein
MATNDDRQVVEAAKLQNKLDAMVTATVKKYDAARAWVLTATALLEEEERMATILIEEARAVAALIEPPLPTPPPAPAGRAAPSDDDYDAAIIANIHV